MSIPYSIKKSKRAKLMRIVVSHEKVEVIMPLKMSLTTAQQFVTAKQAWIETTLAKLRHKVQAAPTLAPSSYQQGSLIPYQGQHYPLVLISSAMKKPQLTFANAFQLAIPQARYAEFTSEAIRAHIIAWCKTEIKRKVQDVVHLHAPQFQLYPRTVRIKAQKSRWGSCGPNNDVNINWLLILAPPQILEYVVVHELCHIRHKNHSAVFWALVAAHLPAYQECRDWLKQNGTRLMQGL